MNIKTDFTIGKVKFYLEIDERDEMEGLHKAAVLSNPRRKCNVCEQYDPTKFKLDSNKDKEGNIYVNVVCVCGAKSKLGQYKAGGYFWHEFEKYEKAAG